MSTPNELLLHHYSGSPYAEKIRLLLGYRRLPWSSLEIPVTPPRPSLAPFLGAFRRTPVLQLGADFFCDTRLIAEVLDAYGPRSRLASRRQRALAAAICGWIEPRAFVLTGPIRFQGIEDVDGVFAGGIDAATFGADRVPFMRPAIDATRFATLHASAGDHLRAYLELIEMALDDGEPFLGGAEPGLADFSAYHLVWWLRVPPTHLELLAGLERTPAWADRMASFGHGEHVTVTADDALARARGAQDASAWRPPWPGRPAPLGARVSVVPDDYGRDPLVGVLAGATDKHVTVERTVEAIGVVRVHVPRLGYEIAID